MIRIRGGRIPSIYSGSWFDLYAFIAFAIAGLLFLLAAHDCMWLSCVLLRQVRNGLDQLINLHVAFNRFFQRLKVRLAMESPWVFAVVAPKAQSSSANTCVIDRYVIRRIRDLAKQRF
jgi:hypothetical protein